MIRRPVFGSEAERAFAVGKRAAERSRRFVWENRRNLSFANWFVDRGRTSTKSATGKDLRMISWRNLI